MLRWRVLQIGILLVASPLVGLWLTTPSHAYVDLAPTLSKIISDSKKIALLEIVEFRREKQELVLKEVRTLVGDASSDAIVHSVAAAQEGTIPRSILQWAEPGSRGVLFASRNTALVCMGRGWYQVRVSGAGQWKLAKERPDLPLAYHGAVSRLADSVGLMLAGKDAVLTVVAHGADNEGASFDLALNRAGLPGLVKVQRIRANLRMPPMVIAASANPAYFLGPGPADENDVASLVEKLKSPDAMVRAEAADDLRCLQSKGSAATASLAKLLADPVKRVRWSAAAALLQIAPGDARALDVLIAGFGGGDLTDRRDVAQAVGLAGSAAAPLADKLTALLKDSDASTRIAALQSISMLGPAAANTVAAVARLLDEPELAIDAADALGRMGPSARSVLPRLSQMLSAQEPTVRWAAVRAMSQIGGDDARPAVDFMVRTLKGGATEVEGYNSMIYLALLGPVAKDAIPTIRSVRIKNPVLPRATLWAIESDRTLPWQSGGFGFGGPGRPGGDVPDFGVLIYEAYVHELGDRLRPAARLLVRNILDGTAGDVPEWGYKILTCGGDEVLDTLADHLTNKDIVLRERAAVALGHMGAAAAPKKDRVEAALSKSATEREKRLLAWCLRKIGRGG
jgi:HEAT repeat protein